MFICLSVRSLLSDVGDEEENNLLHLLRLPRVEEPVGPCCLVRSFLLGILNEYINS